MVSRTDHRSGVVTQVGGEKHRSNGTVLGPSPKRDQILKSEPTRQEGEGKKAIAHGKSRPCTAAMDLSEAGSQTIFCPTGSNKSQSGPNRGLELSKSAGTTRGITGVNHEGHDKLEREDCRSTLLQDFDWTHGTVHTRLTGSLSCGVKIGSNYLAFIGWRQLMPRETDQCRNPHLPVFPNGKCEKPDQTDRASENLLQITHKPAKKKAFLPKTGGDSSPPPDKPQMRHDVLDWWASGKVSD